MEDGGEEGRKEGGKEGRKEGMRLCGEAAKEKKAVRISRFLLKKKEKVYCRWLIIMLGT